MRSCYAPATIFGRHDPTTRAKFWLPEEVRSDKPTVIDDYASVLEIFQQHFVLRFHDALFGLVHIF